MHPGRHLRRDEIALIGIVLLACGVAALLLGGAFQYRLVSAIASWLGAAACFTVAHRPR